MWRHESLFYLKELSGGTHIPHPGFPHSGPSLSVWPEANSKIRAPTFLPGSSTLLLALHIHTHLGAIPQICPVLSYPLGLCSNCMLWPEVPPSSSHSVLGLGKTSQAWLEFPVSPSNCSVCILVAAPIDRSRPHNQASDRVSTNRRELPGQQT